MYSPQVGCAGSRSAFPSGHLPINNRRGLEDFLERSRAVAYGSWSDIHDEGGGCRKGCRCRRETGNPERMRNRLAALSLLCSFTIHLASTMAPQQPKERELSAPLPPSPPTEISTSVSEKDGDENEEVATLEGDDDVDEEGGEGQSEVQEEESKDDTEQIREPGVHKGQDDWTAVWSPECVFLPAHDALFLSAHVGLLALDPTPTTFGTPSLILPPGTIR